jgi:hypothetical protein
LSTFWGRNLRKQKSLEKKRLIIYSVFIIFVFLLSFYLSYNFNIGGQFVSVVNQTTTSTTTTTVKPKFKVLATESVNGTTTTLTTTKTSTTILIIVEMTTTTVKSSGGGGGGGRTTTTTIPKPVAKIIINEIMYNPPGSDQDNEWVEIYNNDTIDCDISDWGFFESNTNHRLTLQQGSITIPAAAYAIITDNATNFLVNYPGFNGTIIKSTFSLSNDGEYIALKDYSSNVVDSVIYNSSYGGDGNNRTLERKGNDWCESLVDGGTPGLNNSVLTCLTVTTSTTTTIETTTTEATSTIITTTSTITSTTIPTTTSTTTTTFTTTTSTTIPIIADHVVISEFQVADEEFVELYNPTDTDVNMTSWYFSYFSSNRDWNNSYRNVEFPDTAIIKPYGFYLIGLYGYPVPISDWQPYPSKQLSDSNGSIAIFPFNPTTKTVEEAMLGRIDAVGWGNPASVYENISCSIPVIGKSLERKPGYWNETAGNGWDSDNNLEDFIIRDIPEPQNSTFVEIQ